MSDAPNDPPIALLAVDAGVRCGLAGFGPDGRLRWLRSSNFGALGRLRVAVPGLLRGVEWLVIEGGGPPADVWLRTARKRGIHRVQLSAEDWRRELLLPREQRSGAQAKAHAIELARALCEHDGAARPTSVRHDAAEAALAGLVGARRTGLRDALPPFEPARRSLG